MDRVVDMDKRVSDQRLHNLGAGATMTLDEQSIVCNELRSLRKRNAVLELENEALGAGLESMAEALRWKPINELPTDTEMKILLDHDASNMGAGMVLGMGWYDGRWSQEWISNNHNGKWTHWIDVPSCVHLHAIPPLEEKDV